MKPRLVRLLVLVCVATAAVGSSLLISTEGLPDSRAIVHHNK